MPCIVRVLVVLGTHALCAWYLAVFSTSSAPRCTSLRQLSGLRPFPLQLSVLKARGLVVQEAADLFSLAADKFDAALDVDPQVCGWCGAVCALGGTDAVGHAGLFW